MTTPSSRALPGLVLGATLIGFAAIVVRLVDVGPTACAFWRMALAILVLAALRAARADQAPSPRGRALAVLLVAGLAFATDLALWHRSIHLTTVANATLLSNLSPVFLALALHFGLGERQRQRFWIGLALALAGAGWLVADSLRIGIGTAVGDLLAATTAIFYAIYQYLVSRARRTVSTLDVMLWAAIAGAAWLLVITLASGEVLLPASLRGWALLASLALVVHIGGQGLIAWAQASLPVAFSSVALLVQPAAAAVFAAIILGEPFGARQALGAAVILAGIVICRLSPAAAPSEPAPR